MTFNGDHIRVDHRRSKSSAGFSASKRKGFAQTEKVENMVKIGYDDQEVLHQITEEGEIKGMLHTWSNVQE